MTDTFLFSREGDVLVPAQRTRGYWRSDSIDGRAIVAALGHEIERRHGAADLWPARLTVDMHRLPPREPLHIETRVVREGGRLRLIEAILTLHGDEYARATCQLLRERPPAPGQVWPGLPPWQVPAPDDLTSLPDEHHMRLAEWRLIAGTLGAVGPRRVWIRPTVETVAGEPLTPFSRVAAIADTASPWVHAADVGIGYINTDVTLHLYRPPDGEWIGLDALLHDEAAGRAIGTCRVYDQSGPIGLASTTAVANTRS
ncbi:acyl-CoA thioesterase domain-containing protein [Novosphingobium sp.]|uniref:acyl-CoA thioesterase domain-containing protein n=1 Tax=Novosphingobium sp. TaxID=1874826 RepID=UPI002636048D|nr:acyl-CoA thioesterase domain-containing protein [Novosphingobium sp.]